MAFLSPFFLFFFHFFFLPQTRNFRCPFRGSIALFLASLYESETLGAAITSLFSLIQDPLHGHQVYRCSAWGGHSSLAELCQPRISVLLTAFPLHGGELHRQSKGWCWKGTERCHARLLATSSVLVLAQTVPLPRAGKNMRCSVLVPWNLGRERAESSSSDSLGFVGKSCMNPIPGSLCKLVLQGWGQSSSAFPLGTAAVSLTNRCSSVS